MKVKSWRRFSRMMVFRVLMVMVMLLTVGSIGQADEYQSLYPLVQSEVDNCLKSPCDGYIRYITGTVGNEILSGAAPASGVKTLKLVLLSRYGNTPAGNFRLFISPGTTSVTVSISSDGYPELVYRFNNHEGNATARYVTLEEGDLGFSPGDSGWLYIENRNVEPLRKVSVTIDVDLAVFVPWYNNSATRWDAYGDPWSADNGVAPVDVCDSEHLDACNESNCPTDGEGYWYNDVGGAESCHEAPACYGDTYYDCLTESQCLSADGDLYWYEDEVDGDKICHPVPACRRDIDTGDFVEDCTPVNCITSTQCEDADFYWYEDEVDGPKTCHDLRACESVDPETEELVCLPENCITPDQCTSSDFYWYEDEIGADKYCHPMPACERELGSGVEVDCSPDNCITSVQCDDANFYWYDDEEDADGERCYQDPQHGVCSQDNLNACKTESDCIAAGGEWRNYTSCGSPYTPPASPPPPPPSTGSGSAAVSGSNWFSLLFATNSAPAPVCDAQHLDACDQGGCAALGDGYWWYDGACHDEPAPVCDAQHLYACDQAGCAALGDGSWWYDGACHDELVQNDYTGRIYDAPVSPGGDADDGVISAGEGLSFEVNVPAGGRMYAVLSIPNVGSVFISNDEILTANVVPVASGTIPVIDDICPYLPEELMGTWTVYTLTVPDSVGESLGELSDYLFQQGGLYALGSYQIEVNCQEQQAQPSQTSGLHIYEIPRSH